MREQLTSREMSVLKSRQWLRPERVERNEEQSCHLSSPLWHFCRSISSYRESSSCERAPIRVEDLDIRNQLSTI